MWPRSIIFEFSRALGGLALGGQGLAAAKTTALSRLTEPTAAAAAKLVTPTTKSKTASKAAAKAPATLKKKSKKPKKAEDDVGTDSTEAVATTAIQEAERREEEEAVAAPYLPRSTGGGGDGGTENAGLLAVQGGRLQPGFVRLHAIQQNVLEQIPHCSSRPDPASKQPKCPTDSGV